MDRKKFQPPDVSAEGPTNGPVATPPTEGVGSTIELKSNPDGAEISVDGRYVGNAPTTLHLPVGDHSIKFELAGYKPWERTLTITQGQSTVVTAGLQKQEPQPPQY